MLFTLLAIQQALIRKYCPPCHGKDHVVVVVVVVVVDVVLRYLMDMVIPTDY